MNLWQRVQQFLGGKAQDTPPRAAPLPPRMTDEEPDPNVPEVTVADLTAALAEHDAPLLVDVREAYEWRLVRMRAARHIPMNELPAHLDTLPRDRTIVVLCAHGSRSYSVAAWLIEQGYDAASLAGGITQWAQHGGAVDQGPP